MDAYPGLISSDAVDVRNAAALVAKDRKTVNPFAPFVVAIRLFEVGDRDEAVYWLYSAQYLRMLLEKALALTPPGTHAHNLSLLQLLREANHEFGRVIHPYAGCDLTKLENVIDRVLSEYQTPPPIVPLSRGYVLAEGFDLKDANQSVADELRDFRKWNRENWDKMQRTRRENGISERACGLPRNPPAQSSPSAVEQSRRE